MNYSENFYRDRQARTRYSAAKVLELLWPVLTPDSVLDVGCATGIWLTEAVRLGAQRVLGIDGSWVPRDQLELAGNQFIEHDLGAANPPQLEDVDRFDLALCIEVAEHLPVERAASVIDCLTNSADVVLFSAAIPGQGGSGHINEQQQHYWYQLFGERGYRCFDCVRPALWHDKDLNLIYQQNMLLYARADSTATSILAGHWPVVEEDTASYQLNRVHPELLTRRVQQNRPVNVLKSAVRARLARLFGRLG